MLRLPQRHESDARIIAALEGTLKSAQTVQVAAHRAICPACEKRFQEYRRLIEGVSASSPLLPAPDLQRIFSQAARPENGRRLTLASVTDGTYERPLRQLEHAGFRPTFWKSSACLATALALGAFAGIWVTHPKFSQRQTSDLPSARFAATSPKLPSKVEPRSNNIRQHGTDSQNADLEGNSIQGISLRDYLRIMFWDGRRSREISNKGKSIEQLSDREMGFVIDPAIQRAFIQEVNLSGSSFESQLQQAARSADRCLVKREGKWTLIPHPLIRCVRRSGIYYFEPVK